MNTTSARPLFDLGLIVITQGVKAILTEQNQSKLDRFIAAHSVGDWGEIAVSDRLLNDEAIVKSGRIMSAYSLDNVRFWIITEADRSVTTLLLPSEY
ncbi:hypothetical protein [Shewanella colwelliana]|uniref:hypothetical protein n=1 Tax=Shewanella colwelliana TaxID=23 RepID=UPI003736C9D1